MNSIDEAIYYGKLSSKILEEALGEPLPELGESYWGDAMRRTNNDPILAAHMAAREMGHSLSSLSAIGILDHGN